MTKKQVESEQALLLSNMYPSRDDRSYGVFVERICTALEQRDFVLSKVVIAGKPKGLTAKFGAYLGYTLSGVASMLSRPSTVYIHYVAHSSIPILPFLFSKRYKLVAHCHGGDIMQASHQSEQTSQIKTWLSRRVLARADIVIVPSQYLKKQVQDKYGIANERIHVSPSGGIDTRMFTPKSSLQRKQVFGYVGRLDPGKGVMTLLQAFEKHIVDNPDATLKIVGSGQLMESLKRQVAARGALHVEFIGPLVTNKLAEFYRQIDYLVFPSELNESLGLVGLEAMASGTPVIGTGNGGMGDYLSDKQNGLTFASADTKALAQVLHQASNLPDGVYSNLSHEAVHTARAFDGIKVMDELARILKGVAKH